MNEYYYDPINSDYIRNKCKTKVFAKKVMAYDEIDSTNTMAKNLGKCPGNHGALVIAEQQSSGRGRLGRHWSSPKGSGIWMSLLLQPSFQPEKASLLTLITALAVNQSIRQITGAHSYIKWPNDIVVDGKKLCGILTEMSTAEDKLECVVIGIGINVNREYFAEDIKDTATSLQLECGRIINRNELIVDIISNLEIYCEYFFRKDSFSDFVDEYNQALVNVNRKVRVIEKDKEYIGIALGINEKGALLIKMDEENGDETETIMEVMSGEVSVRGIYGYT